jgi:hypothetical protein
MVTTESVSLKDYLADFMPSLDNFFSKCPLKIKRSLSPDNGKLYVEILDNSKKSIDGFSVDIDPNQNKRSQIRTIKEKLQNFYPNITQTKIVAYTPEEMEVEITNNGLSIKEALKLTHSTTIQKYQILRAHHKFNEFDVIDLETNKILKFKLRFKTHHIPTATFLEKLEDNPEAMSKVFFDAYEFKKVLS